MSQVAATAKALGVSPSTVKSWRRAGCPRELGKARTWAARNRPGWLVEQVGGRWHGGRRAGAGRPRGSRNVDAGSRRDEPDKLSRDGPGGGAALRLLEAQAR